MSRENGDNAAAVFAFKLKRNPLYLTRDQARADVFQYIEGFYNRRRLHSGIGYLTPEQKAECAAAASAA